MKTWVKGGLIGVGIGIIGWILAIIDLNKQLSEIAQYIGGNNIPLQTYVSLFFLNILFIGVLGIIIASVLNSSLRTWLKAGWAGLLIWIFSFVGAWFSVRLLYYIYSPLVNLFIFLTNPGCVGEIGPGACFHPFIITLIVSPAIFFGIGALIGLIISKLKKRR